MFRTTLAGLLANKVRLLLSSVAIFLGVGFVAGTLVLSASMQQSFMDSFARDAKGVDAAVLTDQGAGGFGGPGGHGGQGGDNSDLLPIAALDAIRAVPGVAAAEGRLSGSAPLLGANGKVITNGDRPGAGMAVAQDAALRGFTLDSGRAPTADSEVVVDQATATAQHFTLGQQVGVVDLNSTVEHFTVVGTIDTGSNKAFSNGSVVGFTTPVAERITGVTGYSQINVRAASGTSPATLVSRISALSQVHGDQVLTGSALATQEADKVVHFTSVFTDALLIFAVVALFVASLVIYNTFTILIAQRMRELALLRCVGASRRQVFGSTLLEAAIVGLLASLLGIVVGVLLALGMMAVLSAFGASFPSTSLVVTPQTALASMLVGTVVTVGSALVPALRSTRVPPVAALGDQYEPPAESRKVGWLRLAIIVVFGSAGLGLAVLGHGDSSGPDGLFKIVGGGCVLFVGVLAAGPLFVGPLTRVFGVIPSLFLGAPAKLATANATRNPFRAASTTAALTIGVTLVTLFTIISASVTASAAATITKHYPFDYQVAPLTGGGRGPGGDGGPVGHGGPNARTVPQSVVAALHARPELNVVAAEYADSLTVNGHDARVTAMDPDAYGTVFLPTLTSGSLADLQPGTIGLDSATLARTGAQAGGTVTVQTPDGGTVNAKVVTVMTSGDAIPEVLMPVADFQRDFRPSGASSVSITAKHGVSTDDSLAAVNAATASDALLTVQSATQYKASLGGGISSVLTFFSALVGLAILIALFGIANTLSLSVIERTRESAMLRAIGLGKGQLRGMLVLEAVQMSLVGAVVGVLLGGLFGWAIMGAFIKGSGGTGVTVYPAGQLVLYVVIAAVAGVVASLLPARRAARTSIVSALAG
ncbi:ABC transporter permease [Kitasatospora sp. NPDC052896]|uniref:ABC transporter permease n=1 Tax=Kitasatospora sp. NPDC052896 TaxID=3364061 RepID=UPI0037C59804